MFRGEIVERGNNVREFFELRVSSDDLQYGSCHGAIVVSPVCQAVSRCRGSSLRPGSFSEKGREESRNRARSLPPERPRLEPVLVHRTA